MLRFGSQYPGDFCKSVGSQRRTVSTVLVRDQKPDDGETYVISKAPFIESTDANPIKAHVTEFYKNNRLQREKIKSHPVYRYGVLREEMQDYILDKLGLLIAQKTIRGTGENGTEYTIISTVLNMNKDIIRMIQKFVLRRRIRNLSISIRQRQ